MPQNTAGLQRQIVRGLSEDDFRRLCLEYFPDVYDNLTSGMTKNRMVELLLERVRKYDGFTNLQAALHQINPRAFAYVATVTPAQPTTRDPRQVFISHAHQDYGWAQRLAGDLEAHGWRVWIAPDSIRPGEKWMDAINRGLDESGVFVLLLTEFAVASRWVRDETNAAIEMQREGELRFLPLQFRPCRLPALWRVYQRIPFRASYDHGLNQLLVSIDPGHKVQVRKHSLPKKEIPASMLPSPKTVPTPTLQRNDPVPLARFTTTYLHGNSAFDESFEIENANGEFLGEFGITVAEYIGADDPRNATAFEVWLFDKHDVKTSTKVVMSDHAFYDERLIAKLSLAGERILAQDGETVVVETSTFIINAQIAEMVYGTDTNYPPQSYFELFKMEIHVWIKEDKKPDSPLD